MAKNQWELMGMAAMIPGTQHMVELMQAELDRMRSALASATFDQDQRSAGIGRAPLAVEAPAEAPEKPKKKGGGGPEYWTPERRAEYSKRMKKRWKKGVFSAKVESSQLPATVNGLITRRALAEEIGVTSDSLLRTEKLN